MKLTLSALAALFALAACAANPEGNLVPDYDLERLTENWRGAATLDAVPGVVNQFEGMPEFFHYVTAAKAFPKGIVSPAFALATNTWYQGEVIFRLPEGAREPQIALGFRTAEGRIRALQESAKVSLNFLRLRAYFMSGSETSAQLVLRANVPGVAFGRMTVVPVTKESDRRPVLIDPVAGRFAVAGGAQKVVNAGQPFLLAEGEGVRASVQVRASKPLKRLRFGFIDALGIYGREVESIGADQVGRWVTILVDRRLPSRPELLKNPHVANPTTLYDTLILARPHFIVEGAEDATVEYRDVQVMLLPPEEFAANKAKNKVAWNPSFESGLWGWSVKFFRYPAPGDRLSRMTLDTTTAAEGTTSLKVVCENETRNKNENFVRIQQNIMRPVPQRDYTISFWAKADRPTDLKLDFGYVAKATFKLGTEWRRYEATGLMKKVGTWEYNELKFEAKLKGETLWLDGVQVEEGKAATDFASPTAFEVNCELPATAFKIYYPEETRTATVRCRAATEALEKGRLEVVLEDFRDRPVKTVFEKEVTLAKGASYAASFALDPGAYGWFHIHSRLTDASGQLLAEGWSALAVVAHAEKVPLADSYCGMMVAPTHIERNGGTECYEITSGFTMDDEFDAYAKTGVRWVRLHTPGDWWANEHTPGDYSFEKQDCLVDTAKRHDIGILADFYAHRPPEWSLPGGKFVKEKRLKPEIAPLVRFTEAWSKHFAGRIGTIQFVNETGGYEAPAFYESCKAITPVLRKNMPGTILMYPSFPGIGLPAADDETPVGNAVRVKKHGWIEQLWELGIQHLCDQYDFHPYINGHATSRLKMVSSQPFDGRISSKYGTFCDTLEQRIRQFRKQVSETLPIVDSESGLIDIVNAPWLFLPPLDRADWYTREVALGQSVRYSILKKAIGFKREYYFMFLGLNLERHGLDLVCKDLTPTAALPARAAFARFLDGSDYVTRLRRNDATWHVVFTKNGKTVVAYWDATLENKPEGSLTLTGVTGSCYDVMGNPIPPTSQLPNSSTSLVLALDATPHYFISSEPAEKVAAAFAASAVEGLKPMSLRLGLSSDGAITVKAVNTSHREIAAAAYPLVTEGPITAPKTLALGALAPGETLETKIRPQFGEGGLIAVTLTTPDGAIASNTLRFPAVRFASACPEKPSLALRYDPETKRVEPAGADGGGGLSGASLPVACDFYFWVTPEALHLRAVATDDTFAPAQVPNDIHKGDLLEYFFDFLPEETAESDTYTSEGFRLNVGPATPVRHEYDRNQAELATLRNSFVKMSEVSTVVTTAAHGWSAETTLPLVRPLAPGRLFRFGVQIQNGDGTRTARVNWTYGRVFKDVSRTGIAVVASAPRAAEGAASANVPFREIGQMTPRNAREITSSNWTIGCETIERGYADFDNYKAYLGPLGLKKARLQCGWARCEQTKGVFDFAWLDAVVDYLRSVGIEPILETSYGNPIYKGAGGRDLGAQLPHTDEGLAAWDRWITALVTHFRDRVRIWAMWNEPDLAKNNSAEATVRFNIRTAKLIRSLQPGAEIQGLSLAMTNTQKFENHLKCFGEDYRLFDQFVYHGYLPNPDAAEGNVTQMKKLAAKYAPGVRLRQGENGAPSAPVKKFALSGIPWTEVSQAKWDMRRMLWDLGHGIESSVFTICDFNHIGREMNVKGLLRANPDHTVVGPKLAYRAVQNVAAVFDGALKLDGTAKLSCSERGVALYRYDGKAPLLVFWTYGINARNRPDHAVYPTNALDTHPVEIACAPFAPLEDPVWVDLLSGRIYAYPRENQVSDGKGVIFKGVPVYDSPCLLTERRFFK